MATIARYRPGDRARSGRIDGARAAGPPAWSYSTRVRTARRAPRLAHDSSAIPSRASCQRCSCAACPRGVERGVRGRSGRSADRQVSNRRSHGADGRVASSLGSRRVRASLHRASRARSTSSRRSRGACIRTHCSPCAMRTSDHFKEFNDRYSYYDGDRVIRILAKILHDVVKGVCSEDGFVGHIGGDDFIFIIPASDVERNLWRDRLDLRCVRAVPVLRAGSTRRVLFRKGSTRTAPSRSTHDGVDRRRVERAPAVLDRAHVSELATEMKSYAKTLTGSVYTIDRRQDPQVGPSGALAGGTIRRSA